VDFLLHVPDIYIYKAIGNCAISSTAADIKAAIEALDRTMQDLRKTDKVIGGVPLLLSGDFRQTLYL